jgi:hypothetical protein
MFGDGNGDGRRFKEDDGLKFERGEASHTYAEGGEDSAEGGWQMLLLLVF